MKSYYKERIIFLDIDGVLNDKRMYDLYNKTHASTDDIHVYIDDTYLRKLNKIYSAYPNTKIVLLPNKKLSYDDIKYIHNKINNNGMEIIDSIDYSIEDNKALECRAEEIYKWLTDHPYINFWVSIENNSTYDEYDKIRSGLSDHVCLTEFDNPSSYKCGISNYVLHDAIDILGEYYHFKDL